MARMQNSPLLAASLASDYDAWFASGRVFRLGEGKMERRYRVDGGDLLLNWATQNIGMVSMSDSLCEDTPSRAI
jgi:hypothetical protein